MKVKNLVLMALVATMGLVSCSKDEHEDGVKTDTMPKSVTLHARIHSAEKRSVHSCIALQTLCGFLQVEYIHNL